MRIRAGEARPGTVGGGRDRQVCCSGWRHYDSAQPHSLITAGFLGSCFCIVRWKTGSLYHLHGTAPRFKTTALRSGVNELGWNDR